MSSQGNPVGIVFVRMVVQCARSEEAWMTHAGASWLAEARSFVAQVTDWLQANIPDLKPAP